MPELNRCVAIYPPMLDIITHRDSMLIKEDGLVLNTIVAYSEKKHRKIDERMVEEQSAGSKHIVFRAGGATFNTQKILSKWMTCDFFGIVGQDKYGGILEEKMKGSNVNIHLDTSKNFSTPWAYFFLSGDERTAVANQDPNVCYSANAKAHILSLITEHTVFYSVSFTFFLKNVAADTLNILKKKTEIGFCAIINLSSEEVVKLFKEQILAVISMCDFVIGNKSEFYELYGEKNEHNLIAWLDSLEVGYAITDGPGELFGKIPGGPLRKAKPIPVSKEVNTTGAGDSFAAGFIGALKDKSFMRTRDILPLLSKGVETSHVYIQNNPRP